MNHDPRTTTATRGAAVRIALWCVATALAVGLWAQTIWAFWSVVCAMGTAIELRWHIVAQRHPEEGGAWTRRGDHGMD